MNDAAWWAAVVKARTVREQQPPQRAWALRKGKHEAAIDLRPVPGIGAEIVLLVDGEWRRTRLFRSHEQAELSGAIADTRAMFEAKGPDAIRSTASARRAGHGRCRARARARWVHRVETLTGATVDALGDAPGPGVNLTP